MQPSTLNESTQKTNNVSANSLVSEEKDNDQNTHLQVTSGSSIQLDATPDTLTGITTIARTGNVGSTDPNAIDFLTGPLRNIICGYYFFTQTELTTLANGNNSYPYWLVDFATTELARITTIFVTGLPSYIKIEERDTVKKFEFTKKEVLKNHAYFEQFENEIRQILEGDNLDSDEKQEDTALGSKLELFCSHKPEQAAQFLSMAIRNGKLTSATRLVYAGAPFEGVDANPLRLQPDHLNLWFAIFSRVNVPKDKSMIFHWLKDNATVERTNIIIHEVAFNGELQCMQLIINHFPELINSKGTDGKTPLQIAVEGEHYEICRLLLNTDHTAINYLESSSLNNIHLNTIYTDVRFPPRNDAKNDEKEEQHKAVFDGINTDINDRNFNVVTRLLSANYNTLTQSEQLAIQNRLQTEFEAMQTLIRLSEDITQCATQLSCRLGCPPNWLHNWLYNWRTLTGIITALAGTLLFVMNVVITSQDPEDFDSTDQMIRYICIGLMCAIILLIPCKESLTYPTLGSLPPELKDRVLEYKVEDNEKPVADIQRDLQNTLTVELPKKNALEQALIICTSKRNEKKHPNAIAITVSTDTDNSSNKPESKYDTGTDETRVPLLGGKTRHSASLLSGSLAKGNIISSSITPANSDTDYRSLEADDLEQGRISDTDNSPRSAAFSK